MWKQIKSAGERAPEGMHAWSALKRDSYTIQPPCLGYLVFFSSKEASGMTKTKHQDKWWTQRWNSIEGLEFFQELKSFDSLEIIWFWCTAEENIKLNQVCL